MTMNINGSSAVFNITNNPGYNSTPLYDKTTVVIKAIDSTVRIWSLVIHLVYFTALFFSKYLKSNSMIYVTHANVISFLFCLIYMCYFSQEQPEFDNVFLNSVLCYVNEIVWAVLRYLRVYSLLLIALHRYLAVFKVSLYKKITGSTKLLMIPIVVVWIGSTLLVFAVKYATSTTYSPTYCAEGFSTNTVNALVFLIIHTSLSTILPSIAILVVYYLITKKLNTLSNKLKINSESVANSQHTESQHTDHSHHHHHHAEMPHHDTTPHTQHADVKRDTLHKKKERKFAYQFFAINLFDMVCSISSIIMNACVSLSLEILYMRNIDRIILILFQSMTPVVTLYFHPNKMELLRKCLQTKKNKFAIPLHDLSIRK